VTQSCLGAWLGSQRARPLSSHTQRCLTHTKSPTTATQSCRCMVASSWWLAAVGRSSSLSTSTTSMTLSFAARTLARPRWATHFTVPRGSSSSARESARRPSRTSRSGRPAKRSVFQEALATGATIARTIQLQSSGPRWPQESRRPKKSWLSREPPKAPSQHEKALLLHQDRPAEEAREAVEARGACHLLAESSELDQKRYTIKTILKHNK